MKKWLVSEAYENRVGGVERCGWPQEYEAETDEQAAKLFWDSGWTDADDTTVIAVRDSDDEDAETNYFWPVRAEW